MLAQAKRMEIEATSMINEASRMKKEAEKMFPSVAAKASPKATTVTETVKTTAKRGRPAKAKAVVNATE
jgi:hypothetical protein